MKQQQKWSEHRQSNFLINLNKENSEKVRKKKASMRESDAISSSC